MNKDRFLLLKTLLLSTSQWNKMRYAKDKKVKNRAIGGLVGKTVILLMLASYSVLICMVLSQFGLAEEIPILCGWTISVMAFLFTLLKTNGYLFHFKEYDMLMSLPFEVKTIVADKFLYMYVNSMTWFFTISAAMMIGYAYYKKADFLTCLLWLLLTFVVPVIPMLVASFFGFLIAKVSAKHKKSNLIQTVLTFILVLFCFSFQYIIQDIVQKNKLELVMDTMTQSMEQLGELYLPVLWFANAVRQKSMVDLILLVVVSVLLFELVFSILAKYYRQINSSLSSHGNAKTYQMTSQKKQSVLNAIAMKEYKRLVGSTNYMVNGAMGEVLAVLLGIFSLVVGMDKIVSIITKGAPVSVQMIEPAIPLIVYFLVGMVATTTCSPSLEGKNYWIIKSLPIEPKTIYQGKMLFNLYLSVPAAVFSTLCLCLSAKVSVINMLLFLMEIIALCCFSSAWGCVCGIKFIKLDWENELEVVKQGACVAVYLLPNMFLTMGVVVLVVVLGLHMSASLIAILVTTVVLILTVLSYFKALAMANKLP